MTLTLRLIRDPGILARVICWWTWGRWSHVEILTPSGWLGARLIGGVRIRPADYIKPVAAQYRTINLTPAQATAFWTFAHEQVGKPYDWRAILGLGVRANWADAPDRWFCSEFVDACFDAAGVPILHADAAYRLSPRDIGLSPMLKVA